ncbi:YHYH protein [Pseudobacteriovorax antillogorgiicola]|uniref:YHYH protein n=1 Tax=Pseudobacteriovorax antillogorgiicola TaxID=1513793 RepID=A0A1Y6CLE9_9BACT|nr:YHYH protein [Pseudobacteriovorax antillogorgiicola]TCS47946.1 YHYH protein [Pseudobacteriovorax antillogorgiicola]SMF58101.1 YHYH protein [Pseudobacteriovorax antillogorgiicola]
MKASGLQTGLIMIIFTSLPVLSQAQTTFPIQSFREHVQVIQDGEQVTLLSDGVPDHKSPYFSRRDSRFEVYNGSNPNFRQNPNSIREQDFTMVIPSRPKKAMVHQRTSLGPIGMALNGVALFNQFAGPNDRPLTDEIDSFDQYNGHPERRGMYHYHVEPLALTQGARNRLIGYLLDGFPVYGPMENGRLVASDDLDEFHGHIHATKEYPEGIFHYHVTADAPYINGGEFYGEPGTLIR